MASEVPVYDDGALRITRTARPPGLAIAGEIDESTYAPLVKALQDVTRSEQPIHIDLGDVVYCDLAGLRAIVRLAGPADASTRRVILYRVPPQLRAVLEIIGWDAVPGLEVT